MERDLSLSIEGEELEEECDDGDGGRVVGALLLAILLRRELSRLEFSIISFSNNNFSFSFSFSSSSGIS